MNNKPKRTERIIQFGEGGFLRAFVDWIVQLTDEKTDFDASVVVVQPIEKGMCDMLEKQNCALYPYYARFKGRSSDCGQKRVIDCISRTVQPYRDFDEYLASLPKTPISDSLCQTQPSRESRLMTATDPTTLRISLFRQR